MLGKIGFLASAEAGASPVIPKPAEIIVGFVAFGLLFLIIRARAVPRFEKAYKDRTEAIEGGLERAETAQREAAEALKTYKAQLADARGEAATLREEARAEGSVILEQMRTAAQEEATRITVSARASIEAERQVAFNSLLNEVGGLATELASRIVGESLDDAARASRVVERFLADVEKSQ